MTASSSVAAYCDCALVATTLRPFCLIQLPPCISCAIRIDSPLATRSTRPGSGYTPTISPRAFCFRPPDYEYVQTSACIALILAIKYGSFSCSSIGQIAVFDCGLLDVRFPHD
jgi:hypothetical protein